MAIREYQKKRKLFFDLDPPTPYTLNEKQWLKVICGDSSVIALTVPAYQILKTHLEKFLNKRLDTKPDFIGTSSM